MKQNENVIELHNLVKKFGNFTALNHMHLEVRRGEVHGFLGPNGAGKSTTIRVILGLLRKNSGQAVLFGQDPWGEAVELHKRLTYVPGDVSLWNNLTGGEVIDLFADLRGGINVKRRNQLLKDFQLDPKKKCRTYSKGNRQKVALVAALATDAELYILDEPTSGLDPLMESVFQKYIKELKAQDKTVLLSSHILAEVEALADRVTIIRNGRTVETGTLAELRHLSRNAIHVHTKKPITGLKTMAGVHDPKVEKDRAAFDVDNVDIGTVMNHLTKFEIISLTSTPPTLEELFMRHYNTTGKPTSTEKE
jgi:ABC-2 type transport system ATP-binding protein